MPTVKLEQVSKRYRAGKRGIGAQRHIIGVENINLTIQQGEFLFVVGGRNSGKTTLLDLITGDLKPNQGRISIDQYELTKRFLRKRRRSAPLFGRVWQEQQTLVRKKTVEESLLAEARMGRRRGETKEDIHARVEKVLGLVGMRGVEKSFPVELTIGECRRVELARALINSPAVLVLDEIMANLDDDNIWDIFHLLTEINRKGTTVIIATQANKYVNMMHKRVVNLINGRIFSDVP